MTGALGRHWPIALVLAGAAVLRLVGLDYGLPFPMVSDEEVLIGGALRMAETGEVIPALGTEVRQILYYPPLLAWLYLVLAAPILGLAWLGHGMPSPAADPWFVFDNLGLVFLAARLSSAALSVATVWVVWRLGRAMFRSEAAGLLAAALFAASWLSDAMAHTARHWSATVFCIWLAGWLAWRYWETGRTKHAAWAGAVAGLGFGISYIGAVGFAAVLLAHLCRVRHRILDRGLLAMFATLVPLVAFFALAHWEAVERLLGTDDPVLPTDKSKSLAELGAMAWQYATWTWWAEPALIVAAALGLPFALRRAPVPTAILVLALTCWLGLLYLAMPWEDRYILPALPVLALLGGALLAGLARPLGRPAITAAAIAILAYPLATAGWLSLLLAAEDTRLQARDWIVRNLSPGTPVIANFEPVKLPTTLAGLRLQRELLPGTLDAEMRARLVTGRVAPSPAFAAVHLDRLPRTLAGDAPALIASLRAMGFDTFATEVPPPGRTGHPTYAAGAAILDEGGRMLARFAPGTDEGPEAPDLATTTLVRGPAWRLFELDRLGPEVVILSAAPRAAAE